MGKRNTHALVKVQGLPFWRAVMGKSISMEYLNNWEKHQENSQKTHWPLAA